MATNTANYNLVKPNGAAGGDLVDINVINANMDAIDTLIKARADEIIADRARLSALEGKVPFDEVVVSSITAVATAGAPEVTIMSFPAINFDGATQCEVTFSCYNETLSVTTDSYFLRFYDGATLLDTNLIAGGSVNAGGKVHRTIWTPAAGNRVVAVKVIRNAGTGTITFGGGSAVNQLIGTVRPLIRKSV